MKAILAGVALLLATAGDGRAGPGPAGPGLGCGGKPAASLRQICADPAVGKADGRIVNAYRALQAVESKQSFATVRAAQAAWLAYVMASCAAGHPADDKNARKDCLEENFTDRAERLAAARVYKSGPLALEPRMRLLTRARPETEESDVYPWMSGAKQAAPFNRYIAAKLELGKRRMDDKELFAFGDEVADLKLYARRTYRVARFDARVVSLQISTFDYTGGAHEALGEEAVNWDMRRAKPIALTDVFAGWKWRRFVVDDCLKDLHRQLAAQQEPDPDRAAVDSVVLDSGNWLWGKDKAIVHFTVYTVASFAGGEYDVDIPYKLLKPYLRPEAPVLP